ncbi:hypothetical protein [Streptomyces bobili]
MASRQRVWAWYQSVDWGKHTTVVAAVVAAAGLAVTAWGTVKSSQVADDQLDQSREQQFAEDRQQASLVNVWTDKGKTIIANRSLDPAGVWLSATGANAPEWGSPYEWLGRIPPCQRVELPSSLIEYLVRREDRATAPDVHDAVTSIVIEDINGNSWKRTVKGKFIQLVEDADLLGSPHHDHMGDKGVRVTELDSCEADAH